MLTNLKGDRQLINLTERLPNPFIETLKLDRIIPDRASTLSGFDSTWDKKTAVPTRSVGTAVKLPPIQN